MTMHLSGNLTYTSQNLVFVSTGQRGLSELSREDVMAEIQAVHKIIRKYQAKLALVKEEAILYQAQKRNYQVELNRIAQVVRLGGKVSPILLVRKAHLEDWLREMAVIHLDEKAVKYEVHLTALKDKLNSLKSTLHKVLCH